MHTLRHPHLCLSTAPTAQGAPGIHEAQPQYAEGAQQRFVAFAVRHELANLKLVRQSIFVEEYRLQANLCFLKRRILSFHAPTLSAPRLIDGQANWQFRRLSE